MSSELANAAGKLSALGPVWVYIGEYRITHGYLHLLVTDRGFGTKGNVYMNDCSYIAGRTSGGPWRIDLRRTEFDGGIVLELDADNGQFVARALRVVVEIDGQEYPVG